MDVIELTLLLKSIGFRLNSIDFDERHFSQKNANENENGASSIKNSQSDIDYNSINVQISCSKSKIVSNLSFKFDDSEVDVATTMDSNKLATCTCPKREQRDTNNSFWEVQSSGTFVNPRRSMNVLMMVSHINWHFISREKKTKQKNK